MRGWVKIPSAPSRAHVPNLNYANVCRLNKHGGVRAYRNLVIFQQRRAIARFHFTGLVCFISAQCVFTCTLVEQHRIIVCQSDINAQQNTHPVVKQDCVRCWLRPLHPQLSALQPDDVADFVWCHSDSSLANTRPLDIMGWWWCPGERCTPDCAVLFSPLGIAIIDNEKFGFV